MGNPFISVLRDEICSVLRGLKYYADGHELQARDARQLVNLKRRADKVIAALSSATEGEGDA